MHCLKKATRAKWRLPRKNVDLRRWVERLPKIALLLETERVSPYLTGTRVEFRLFGHMSHAEAAHNGEILLEKLDDLDYRIITIEQYFIQLKEMIGKLSSIKIGANDRPISRENKLIIAAVMNAFGFSTTEIKRWTDLQLFKHDIGLDEFIFPAPGPPQRVATIPPYIAPDIESWEFRKEIENSNCIRQHSRNRNLWAAVGGNGAQLTTFPSKSQAAAAISTRFGKNWRLGMKELRKW